jgi:hypothetical protein
MQRMMVLSIFRIFVISIDSLPAAILIKEPFWRNRETC